MARDNAKARRIILELLHCPDGSLTKYRLGKETETNISWVIGLLRKLEDKKLVKVTKVLDVDKLIDYYLTIEKQPKYFDFFIQQPEEYFLAQKKTHLLTTYAAENNISHHLFLTRFDAYVKEEEIQVWKEELFKKGLIGKGNVRLIVAHDNYIFKFIQKLRGLHVVTVPLLLIDLKREGGVCMQAYEYLVKKYVP